LIQVSQCGIATIIFHHSYDLFALVQMINIPQLLLNFIIVIEIMPFHHCWLQSILVVRSDKVKTSYSEMYSITEVHSRVILCYAVSLSMFDT
jgi:hypothetical protein